MYTSSSHRQRHTDHLWTFLRTPQLRRKKITQIGGVSSRKGAVQSDDLNLLKGGHPTLLSQQHFLTFLTLFEASGYDLVALHTGNSIKLIQTIALRGLQLQLLRRCPTRQLSFSN